MVGAVGRLAGEQWLLLSLGVISDARVLEVVPKEETLIYALSIQNVCSISAVCFGKSTVSPKLETALYQLCMSGNLVHPTGSMHLEKSVKRKANHLD